MGLGRSQIGTGRRNSACMAQRCMNLWNQTQTYVVDIAIYNRTFYGHFSRTSLHQQALKFVILHKQTETSVDATEREFVKGRVPSLLVLLSPNIFLREFPATVVGCHVVG